MVFEDKALRVIVAAAALLLAVPVRPRRRCTVRAGEEKEAESPGPSRDRRTEGPRTHPLRGLGAQGPLRRLLIRACIDL